MNAAATPCLTLLCCSSMKISPQRIKALLDIHGFELTWLDECSFDIRFSRASSVHGLYEQVWIVGLGKRGEAVACRFGIAAVSGGKLVVKGLGNTYHVPEIDEDNIHGFTEIACISEAKTWEQRLADLVNRKPEFFQMDADQLYDITSSARKAAHRYLDFLPNGTNINFSDLKNFFLEKATQEQTIEATTIAEWPGVARVRKASHIYEIAALLILMYSEQVEDFKSLLDDRDYLSNQELFWRVQIIVDCIIRMHESWQKYFIYK